MQAKLVLGTNVTGTLYLMHKVAGATRARNRGCILITSSIAGFMPGSFQAVYNGTKAFIDSFSFALRNELKDIEVTVTCLMPGPTDTEFFERADKQQGFRMARRTITKYRQALSIEPVEMRRARAVRLASLD